MKSAGVVPPLMLPLPPGLRSVMEVLKAPQKGNTNSYETINCFPDFPRQLGMKYLTCSSALDKDGLSCVM